MTWTSLLSEAAQDLLRVCCGWVAPLIVGVLALFAFQRRRVAAYLARLREARA